MIWKLSLVIAITVGLGCLLTTRSAYADWGGQGIGTGSLVNLNDPSKAAIGLLKCNDGTVATWKKSTVTFRISPIPGLDLGHSQAIRAGFLSWNNTGSPVKLVEAAPGATADINVQVVLLAGITKVGTTTVNCATGAAGITSVSIQISATALTPKIMRNVAAHEAGHALGLGHSSVPGQKVDLMSPDFALLAGATGVICPSNLDVGALVAKTHPYSIAVKSWAAPKTC